MKITMEDLPDLAEADWDEHRHQCEVIKWCDWNTLRYPELEWIYANVNGEKRTKWERGRKLAEGMKAGVPDLHLPVARLNRHGLWIEMKAKRNKPTESQDRWAAALTTLKHIVVTCWTWRSATDAIEDYLNSVPVKDWRK